MIEPIEHHVADGKSDPAANYSRLSLAIHWFGALAVIVLFLSHEGAWLGFHISLGILLAIPLIARVIYRWSQGFPRPHDQHPGLNFLERIIMIAMLIAIFILMLTGLLLPLFRGEAYALFGAASWTAPYNGNAAISGLLGQLHSIAGHAIVPLFAAHILSFARHLFSKKNSNKSRMIKSLPDGK